MISGFQCAGCDQWNEIDIDPTGGKRQRYVQDCEVCCKPNLLHLQYDDDENEYVVSADLE